MGGEYSSATAVRKTINQYYCDPQNIKLLEEIKKTMPISSYNIVLDQLNKSINPVLYSNFEQMIFCKLRSLLVNDLKNINGIEEGLENKIKKAILFSIDIEGLITAIKSKRYTRTRIQRIIIHSLFSLTKKEVKNFNNDGPLYCRILGMSDKGRILLRKAKTVSCLPIVQKLKYFYQHNKKYNNTSILKMIDYDILATDLYVLAYNQKYLKTGSQDFTNKVEMYKI